MAEAAFPDVDRIPFEGPDSKNPLAFRFYDANEVVEGKTMKDQLRFSVAYWHTMRGTGGDPFGPGTMFRPWESGGDSVENAMQPRPRGLRVHAQARRALLLLPRPRRGPRGRQALRDQQEPRQGRQGDQEGDAADGHQAALGHRQPLQQSPLHARRGHQPQRRRLRLRRRPGEEGPRSDPRAGRRRLHLLGRPRRLPDPLEHRHEARAGPPRPLHAHGRRLCQADRLHRPVLLRAQAQGAHQAPVRLRRRRLHQLPPRLRAGEARQAEHRDQPRHPGRPHRRARVGLRRPPGLPRLGRRQHRRPAAGLGHRPVPHRRLPGHEDHATTSSSTAG